MKYHTPIIPFGDISLNSPSMPLNDKNKAMVTLFPSLPHCPH